MLSLYFKHNGMSSTKKKNVAATGNGTTPFQLSRFFSNVTKVNFGEIFPYDASALLTVQVTKF